MGHLAKKQRLQQPSSGAKLNSAFVALEGVYAVKALLTVMVLTLESHPDPITDLVVEYLTLAVDKIE